MAKDYPDTAIRDDWNARQSKPVTSYADVVKQAGNEPTIKTPAELRDYVETSAGAVPKDSDQAKAAADVDIQGGGSPLAILNPEDTGTDAGDSGATEPTATKTVSRTKNTAS